MAKITRYSGNLLAFASAALANERTVFGDTLTESDDLTANVTLDFLRGWGIVGPDESPNREDFNALAYTLSQFLAYLHQTGVAEYDAAQEYNIGSWTTDGGVLYVSLVDANIGNDPATDTAASPTGTYWQRFGSAAYYDAGSAADEVLLLDGSGDIPAGVNIPGGQVSSQVADSVHADTADSTTTANNLANCSAGDYLESHVAKVTRADWGGGTGYAINPGIYIGRAGTIRIRAQAVSGDATGNYTWYVRKNGSNVMGPYVTDAGTWREGDISVAKGDVIQIYSVGGGTGEGAGHRLCAMSGNPIGPCATHKSYVTDLT